MHWTHFGIMSVNFGTAILFFYYIFLQRSAISYECHREGYFVKVEPDALAEISPIEVTTTTEATFCSIKCLDYPGCNSFAYLNYTSSENCLLSSSVDGASVSGASGVVEIYKKAELDVPKGCQPNPCLNEGTCTNTCEEPFYHCACPDETTGLNCTSIYIPFNARFTHLNGYGKDGPTTIGNYYNGQDHETLTTLQNGTQLFTVPYTGVYKIVATGAGGGVDHISISYRAKGATAGGYFNLEKGQVLKILVGQFGHYNSAHSSAGGGGGTFVATSSNVPLIVGGGGGGIESATKVHDNAHASTSTSGMTNCGSTFWSGGTNGNGATEADSSNSGGGGGGFYTNGRSSVQFGGTTGIGGEGGYSFIEGGKGGRSYINVGNGGFGGGGGAYGGGGGAGGGGGYSGGASGDNVLDSCGGGGGSFNSGFLNKFHAHADNAGHGYVIIQRMDL